MNVKKGMIHHSIMSAKTLNNTNRKNKKRKIPNAIYVNTEKNVQNIVLG